jgi:RbsD / FucU transport protein family
MGELTARAEDWERRLEESLALFGHRNWIVVADAAYPAQASAGIETISTAADQVEVLRKVIDAIESAKHIRAKIHLDDEQRFVYESDAPGVVSYRQELEFLLAGTHVSYLPHEDIIRKLDKSAQTFRILILKTELAIPYTSVFFELDCGYWSPEAEERLRKAFAQSRTGELKATQG